jgi:hypothetical protein
MPANQPLTTFDYAPPLPARRRFSVPIFVISAVPTWGLAAMLVFVAPWFKQLYIGFKLKLPAPTQLLLEISDFANNQFGWVALVLLPFALALIVHRLPLKGRWLRLLIITGTMLMLLGIMLILAMPMISLLNAIR